MKKIALTTLLALAPLPALAAGIEDGMLQCGAYGYSQPDVMSLCEQVEAIEDDATECWNTQEDKDTRIVELEEALRVRERLLTVRLNALTQAKRELKKVKAKLNRR